MVYNTKQVYNAGDNVRRFLIKIKRNQPKALFSSRMNFRTFVLRNYQILKSFVIKPEILLKDEEAFSENFQDIMCSSVWDPPEEIHDLSDTATQFETDNFLTEFGTSSHRTLDLLLQEQQASFSELNIQHFPQEENELPPEWTTEKSDHVASKSATEIFSSPTENDLTFQEIEEFLSDIEYQQELNLDELVKDCGDLDFNDLTPSDKVCTEPEKVLTSTSRILRVLQNNRVSSYAVIVFQCSSNCQTKHVAKFQFSCQGGGNPNNWATFPCNSNSSASCIPTFHASLSEKPLTTAKRYNGRQLKAQRRRIFLERKAKKEESHQPTWPTPHPKRCRIKPSVAKNNTVKKNIIKTSSSTTKLDKTCYVVLHRIKVPKQDSIGSIMSK